MLPAQDPEAAGPDVVMTYEPTTYWRTRGETFAAQELALADVLRDLDYETVLDVGCGTGRIGSLIRGLQPGAAYAGIDVSPDVLRAASNRLPHGTFHESSLARFRPERTWGLVVASELLMHVPPDDVAMAVAKLRDLSARWIVTIDYVGSEILASHNFAHDYQSLLRPTRTIPVGLQSIHVVSK